MSVRFRVTYARFAELRDDVEQQMVRGGLLVKLADDYAHDTPVTLEVVMPDGVVLAGASRVLQVLAGYGVAISVGEDLVAMAQLACVTGDDTNRSGDARHERVDDGGRAARPPSRPPFETKTPAHGSRGFETRTPAHGSRGGFETRTPAYGSRGAADPRTPSGFESRTPSQGSRPPFETKTPSHGSPFEGGRPPFESKTPSSPGIDIPPPTSRADDPRPRSSPAIELPRTATTSRPPANARTATRSGPYSGPPIVETSRPTRSRTIDIRSADADEQLSSSSSRRPGSEPASEPSIELPGEPPSERDDPFALTLEPETPSPVEPEARVPDVSTSRRARPARAVTESEPSPAPSPAMDVPGLTFRTRSEPPIDPPTHTPLASREGMTPVMSRVPTSSQPAIVPPSTASSQPSGLSRTPLSSNPRIHPIDPATLASIDAALDAMQSPPSITPTDAQEDSAPSRVRATKPPYDDMSNAEKIQVALHGNRDERNLVLRDRNRTLHAFVLKNPAINLEDVTTIAKNALMGPDILKQISERKDWFQRPAVATALARNPKTPAEIAIRALDYVPMEVLRQMAKGVGALPHVTQAARKKVISS